MLRFTQALALIVALAAGMIPLAGEAHGQGQQSEPLVVVHRQPAIPLVSLRLSLLVDDPPGLAGAGHLVQHLHHERLRSRARTVGGQVRMERSSDAIIYTVTGPAAELDYLVGLLKETLTVPQVSTGARLSAERDLMQERLAEWETADAHLRSALRSWLFPADLSAAGTALSAPRLSDASVEEMWERLYRPDRLVLIAVGDVEPSEVRAAFAGLPAPPPPGPLAIGVDTASRAPLAAAEATRAWFGAGFRTDDLPPAAVSVAARLLARDMAGAITGADVTSDHWWTHHGQALVLVAALQPGQLNAARARLEGAFARLARTVDDEDVADAAAAIRHDMLFYARTPAQMAEVLGRFVDRGGDADSAARFHAELEALDAEDLREVLLRLAEAPAVHGDIPPQRLNVNP